MCVYKFIGNVEKNEHNLLTTVPSEKGSEFGRRGMKR